MGRKPRVDRTPEEKWQIVQEGMRLRRKVAIQPPTKTRSLLWASR